MAQVNTEPRLRKNESGSQEEIRSVEVSACMQNVTVDN